MHLRSRIAAAPWPVWLPLSVGLYALILWPVLLLLRPAMVGGMAAGLASTVVTRVVDDRERRSLSGWDRAQRLQVMDRARRGTLPATDEERAALRRLVERDERERRSLVWILPVLMAILVAVAVLMTDDRSTTWTAVTIGWFVLVGALLVRMELADRTRRRGILAALDCG